MKPDIYTLRVPERMGLGGAGRVGEIAGSNPAPAEQSERTAPMPQMTKEERVEAIRQAAVAFANDYGPLPAANEGSDAAMHEVAARMVRACRRNGLKIVADPYNE